MADPVLTRTEKRHKGKQILENFLYQYVVVCWKKRRIEAETEKEELETVPAAAATSGGHALKK